MFARRSGRIRYLSRSITLELLEERIVLDAAIDPAPVTQENVVQTETDQSATQQTNDSMDQPPESDAPGQDLQGQDTNDTDYLSVALISNCLDHVNEISQAVNPESEIVVYDSSTESVESIGKKLESLVNESGLEIGHLAIFSHGDTGELILGEAQVLNVESFADSPEIMAPLTATLNDDCRIDLYGCNIGYGDEGALFVDALADITGATVWASEDTTASPDLGGDWELEVRSSDDGRAYMLDSSALAHYEAPLAINRPYSVLVMSEQTLESQGEPYIDGFDKWRLVTYDESECISDEQTLTMIIDSIEDEMDFMEQGDGFFENDYATSIEFITDGSPGELIFSDSVSITLEDLNGKQGVQDQFARITGLVYDGDYVYGSPYHLPSLCLWGSEIAKGSDGEAFVNKLGEIMDEGWNKRIAALASDDVSGGVVSRMFNRGDPVPECDMDWELEYQDSVSRTASQTSHPSRLIGMTLGDNNGFFYENYCVVARSEWVGSGDHIVSHHGACVGDIDLYFVHPSLIGARLDKIIVRGEADVDGESYLYDMNPTLTGGTFPADMTVPAYDERVDIYLETGQTGYYQGQYEDDDTNDLNSSEEDDTFRLEWDLGALQYSETDDGVFKTTFSFAEGRSMADWYLQLFNDGYFNPAYWNIKYTPIPVPLTPCGPGVDAEDWIVEFPKMDSILQDVFDAVFGKVGYLAQVIYEGVSAEMMGYHPNWSNDWDDLLDWQDGDEEDDRYVKAALQWNPAPEKIRDLEAEVFEHTEDVTIQLTNRYIHDVQGISGYTIKTGGYSEDLFSNVSVSADGLGITFDTAEISEPQWGHIVFTATDNGGLSQDFMIEIQVGQKADAVPFQEEGMSLSEIDLEGWGLTSADGTTYPETAVKFIDLPDYGDVYFLNSANEYQPVSSIDWQTQTLDWSKTSDMYYKSDPGYTGADSFQYMVGFNDGQVVDGDDTCYSSPATAHIEVETNPGVYQSGAEDTSVKIEEWGSDGDSGEVEFTNMGGLSGSGELVFVADGGAEAIINVGDSYDVGPAAGGDFVFKPNADWNGSVAFSYKYRSDSGQPWENRTGVIEIEPKNDVPTVTGYHGVKIHSWDLSGGDIYEGEGAFIDSASLEVGDETDMQYAPSWEKDDYLYTLELTTRAKNSPDQAPFAPSFGNGFGLTYNPDYRPIWLGDGYEDVWTATGTLDQLNQALDSGVRLNPNYSDDRFEHFNGDAQFIITLNDLGSVGGDSFMVGGDLPQYGYDALIEFNVKPVNDAPDLYGGFEIIGGTAEAAPIPEGTTGVLLTDLDNDPKIAQIWDGFDNAYQSIAGQDYRLEFTVTSKTHADVHPYEIALYDAPDGLQLQLDSDGKTWWVEGEFDKLNEAMEGGLWLETSVGCEDYFGRSILEVTVSDLGFYGGGPLTDTLEIHMITESENDAPEILGDPSFSPLLEGHDLTISNLSVSDWRDHDWLYGDSGKDLKGKFTFKVEADDFPDEDPFELGFGNGYNGLIYDSANDLYSVESSFKEIQEAMDSGILLEITPEDSDFYGEVTLTIEVDDLGNIAWESSGLTGEREIKFSVAPVNNPPVADIEDPSPGDLYILNEENSIELSVTASDYPDTRWSVGGDPEYTVTLTAQADDFSVAPGEITLVDDKGKVNYHASPPGVLCFSCNHGDLQTVLGKVRFTGAKDFYGDVTLGIAVNDNGNVGQGDIISSTDSVALKVNPINDPIVCKAPDDTQTPEDLPIHLYGWNVYDPDIQYADPANQQVWVKLSSTSGTLKLNSVEGLAGDLDGSDGALTFTGHPDQINSALNGMILSPAPDFYGLIKIELNVNDLGNFGIPVTLTTAYDYTNIIVNELPELDELGKPQSYYESQFISNISDAARFEGYHSPDLSSFFDGLYSSNFAPQLLKQSEVNEVKTEFEFLMTKALLDRENYSSSSSGVQAWDNLFDFLSRSEEQAADSHWLDLEEFLTRLREWQFGQVNNLPGLNFSDYTVKLWEWLESNLELTDIEIFLNNTGVPNGEQLSDVRISPASQAFDMDEINISYALLIDLETDNSTNAREIKDESEMQLSMVFDMDDLSFGSL